MQRLKNARHQVEGDTGARKSRNHKYAGIQQAGLLVEAQAQVFRHRAGSGAVVEGHHEDASKKQGRDSAEREKEGSFEAIHGSGGAHGNHFLGAKAGGDEGESRNPGGQRAPGLKKIAARLDVRAE